MKEPDKFESDWKRERIESKKRYECVICGTVVTPSDLKKPDRCPKCYDKGKFEEIKFSGFVYKNFDDEIKSIEQLEKIIKENFPSIWMETKACLSTVQQLSLKNMNGCPTLILTGNPSDEKTTVDSFFYGHSIAYNSDEFSPRAFVSHATNVKNDDLEKIDLLPRIKNKVLITPELAPLFRAPRDKLIENFAMLTRVLDGEGLNRDSGTHGHRGYSGDFKFAWLGATTPIKDSVWKIMGNIGNRLFFYQVNEKNRSDEDYLDMFSGREYEEKIKICRGAVRSFLDNQFKKYPIRNIEWGHIAEDREILMIIIRYAKLMAKLRGSINTWKSHEEGGGYEHQHPQIEEPPRAINALRGFARGHALINGRRHLTKDDLEIVRRICLSSMPYDRVMFFNLLAKHKGRLSSELIAEELNCSTDVALRTMKIFEILGVVSIKDLPIGSAGRPLKFIEIEKEFNEILDTQGRNEAINNKSGEINPVRVKYTGVQNSAINNKPQEIYPMFEAKEVSEDNG